MKRLERADRNIAALSVNLFVYGCRFFTHLKSYECDAFLMILNIFIGF